MIENASCVHSYIKFQCRVNTTPFGFDETSESVDNFNITNKLNPNQYIRRSAIGAVMIPLTT